MHLDIKKKKKRLKPIFTAVVVVCHFRTIAQAPVSCHVAGCALYLSWTHAKRWARPPPPSSPTATGIPTSQQWVAYGGVGQVSVIQLVSVLQFLVDTGFVVNSVSVHELSVYWNHFSGPDPFQPALVLWKFLAAVVVPVTYQRYLLLCCFTRLKVTKFLYRSQKTTPSDHHPPSGKVGWLPTSCVLRSLRFLFAGAQPRTLQHQWPGGDRHAKKVCSGLSSLKNKQWNSYKASVVGKLQRDRVEHLWALFFSDLKTTVNRPELIRAVLLPRLQSEPPSTGGQQHRVGDQVGGLLQQVRFWLHAVQRRHGRALQRHLQNTLVSWRKVSHGPFAFPDWKGLVSSVLLSAVNMHSLKTSCPQQQWQTLV